MKTPSTVVTFRLSLITACALAVTAWAASRAALYNIALAFQSPASTVAPAATEAATIVPTSTAVAVQEGTTATFPLVGIIAAVAVIVIVAIAIFLIQRRSFARG